MVPEPTRRRVLQGSGVALSASLGGCMGVFDDNNDGGGGGEPDAGSDSYGIVLVNEMERAHTVTIAVRRLGESEAVFSETAEIEPDEHQEWEEVLTEQERQYRVVATIEDAPFYDNEQQNQAAVSVGTSMSPDVENVVVIVAPYFDERTVWVNTSQVDQV
jgi:hypothetical protein